MNMLDDNKLTKLSERYAFFRDFYQFCIQNHNEAVIAFLKREQENNEMITKVRSQMQGSSKKED